MLLKRVVRGEVSWVAHLFSRWGLMLSGPIALLGSVWSSSFFTSSSVTVRISKVALVRGGIFGGVWEGSGTVILEEKCVASNSALSLLLTHSH